MPIYAYRCGSCGHAKDVLQKMSDPQLTVCPACGEATFTKQLTAAGFQLKGTGWYATDFKGGSAGAPAAGKDSGDAGGASTPATSTETPATTTESPVAKSDSGSKGGTATGGGCATSCACH